MKVVKVEMRRQGGECIFRLLRFLISGRELEHMQTEFPFPLEVVADDIPERFLEEIKEYAVKGCDGYWFYDTLGNIERMLVAYEKE